MASLSFSEPGDRHPGPVDLRRVYRWRYRDPVMGMISESKLMAPDEALALDTAAEIIPGSEVVIEERRPSGGGFLLWR